VEDQKTLSPRTRPNGSRSDAFPDLNSSTAKDPSQHARLFPNQASFPLNLGHDGIPLTHLVSVAAARWSRRDNIRDLVESGFRQRTMTTPISEWERPPPNVLSQVFVEGLHRRSGFRLHWHGSLPRSAQQHMCSWLSRCGLNSEARQDTPPSTTTFGKSHRKNNKWVMRM
jgi:hypothetical protein